MTRKFNWIFISLATMSLLSLAWAIYASYAYFSLASELKQTSAQHARAESHKLVGDIKTALSPLPPKRSTPKNWKSA